MSRFPVFFGILILVSIGYPVSGIYHHIYVFNHCAYPVWLGITPNAGSPVPLYANGTVESHVRLDTMPEIQTGPQGFFYFKELWSGSLWGRTGCDETTGHCLTGDCGKLECPGTTGPTGPTTTIHFGFDSLNGRTLYEVSLVNGFNIPLDVFPSVVFQGWEPVSNDTYDCTRAGCAQNLNEHCPEDLMVKDGGGRVVACRSPCQAHNTDEYCCRGEHSQASRCLAADWPQPYTALFGHCPDAKKYQFDATTSLFSCLGAENLGIDFDVHFCPK